jgi:hypothetical protein
VKLPPEIATKVSAAFAQTVWWAVITILIAFGPTMFPNKSAQDAAADSGTTSGGGNDEDPTPALLGTISTRVKRHHQAIVRVGSLLISEHFVCPIWSTSILKCLREQGTPAVVVVKGHTYGMLYKSRYA